MLTTSCDQVLEHILFCAISLIREVDAAMPEVMKGPKAGCLQHDRTERQIGREGNRTSGVAARCQVFAQTLVHLCSLEGYRRPSTNTLRQHCASAYSVRRVISRASPEKVDMVPDHVDPEDVEQIAVSCKSAAVSKTRLLTP